MRLLKRQTHLVKDHFLARPLAAGAPLPSERDTIYFDASCGMCTTSARRLKRLVSPHGFALAPLQDPGVAPLLGFEPNQIPDEMKLHTRAGQILGGADAIVYICRRISWAWPIWAISRIPLAMRFMRRIYRNVAKNRHRISKACRIDAKIF